MFLNALQQARSLYEEIRKRAQPIIRQVAPIVQRAITPAPIQQAQQIQRFARPIVQQVQRQAPLVIQQAQRQIPVVQKQIQQRIPQPIRQNVGLNAPSPFQPKPIGQQPLIPLLGKYSPTRSSV